MKIVPKYLRFEPGNKVVVALTPGNTVGGKHEIRIPVRNAIRATYWGNILSAFAYICRAPGAPNRKLKEIQKICRQALKGGKP